LTAKASVLVVGSSNTDLVIKMERLPKPGETMLGGKFVTSAGGKGANQAVSAARAGAAVTFIARIGRDNFGDKAIAGLAAEGINVKYMVRDEAHPSGVALILVDRAGENTIAVAPGSNGQLSTADLHKARSAFLKASVLLLQLETPLETVEAAAEMAASAGARIILNPAPAQALPGSLLRRVFVLTPNETETALLTGVSLTNEESRKRAARILFSRGVQNVIFTLGSRGIYVARKDSVRMIRGRGRHGRRRCLQRSAGPGAE
jgi:ribokinase